MGSESDLWPSLPLEEWQDTYATLHLWTQIVGKIRLSRMPWINHYGPNCARLQEIKARYDPDNFFHMNQNIQPAE